jgi:DNA-binding response OmpR family regulator
MDRGQKNLKIALYSDDSSVRASVITAKALRMAVDSGENFDLFILDGEAVPEGGLGVAKQLKDEVFNCGVVIVLVARSADAWLAGWSRAEGVITHPIDPFTLAKSVAEILAKNPIAS